MAHIEEFTITGLVGNKKPLHYKLNRDVNIFFGLNGSGKTTLLKILHSAMSLDTSILENANFDSAEVKVFAVNDNKTYTLTLKKEKIEKKREKQVASKDDVFDFDLSSYIPKKPQWNITPQLPSLGFNHKYLPTSRLYVSQDGNEVKSSIKLSEEELDRVFAKSIQNIWSGFNSTILKTVNAAQEEGLANILKAVLSTATSNKKKGTKKINALDPIVAYKRVEAFLQRQNKKNILGSVDNFSTKYNKNAQLRNIVNDIDIVERKIEVAVEPRDNIERLVKKMYSGHKKINFLNDQITITTDDNRELGLNVLSSGEKQLLKILLEMLGARMNSIIIDEPEISMHIDWQSILVESLSFLNPKAQLIVATHSPEIMATIAENKIFRI